MGSGPIGRLSFPPNGGGGGAGDVAGPGSSTDNALARYDGTTGKLLQDGLVTESDAGALSGATQLNVDNLRLDGNVLSSTDANGNITIAPNGTGSIIASIFVAFGGSTSSFPAIKRSGTDVLLRLADDSGATNLVAAIVALSSSGSSPFPIRLAPGSSQIQLSAESALVWSTTNGDANQTKDTGIKRDSAGVQLDTNGGSGLGARLSRVWLYGASANLLTTTATLSIRTASGGSGTALVSGQILTGLTAAGITVAVTVAVSAIQTATPLFFRITQGVTPVAGTVKALLELIPAP